MNDLDPLDRRVLLELDRDARQSVSDIARTIREGRDRVEYRIQRLVASGIIRKFTVFVDLYKLGYTMFKVYLRLENNRSKVAELLAHLRKHPRVYWIAHCDGGWDLVVAIFATTAQEFHEFHTKLLSEFNSLILNFNAYTLVELKFYSRNYLAKGSKVYSHEWGKPGKVEVDKVDLKILRSLANDSRTSVLAIGEQLDIAPHVVRYRIERLEKLEVITGYRTDFDLSKLGILYIKTQFFLRNYELSLREALLAYCHRNPHITNYIEQLGDCNLEIEFEVPNYDMYYEIIDDIRSEYAKLVRNFQTIFMRSVYHYTVPEQITQTL